jgi:hypothetical protein
VCDMRTHGSILGTMQEVQYSPVVCAALHCTALCRSMMREAESLMAD